MAVSGIETCRHQSHAVLQRNLTVCERLLEELNITTSTLRTHFRSIYAKTETSSRSELLFHLISKTPHMTAADIQVA